MKTKVLILALVLVLALTATVAALVHGNLELPHRVLSGGASDSASGGSTLQATLGQPVVGMVSGGETTLGQGFWHSSSDGYDIYLPLILR